ncbi:hypothetical protein GZL_09236 [Streptomyces sp. 769]|nr:hypothetical protein GZL_09236 [Streptomyces sp. 769]
MSRKEELSAAGLARRSRTAPGRGLHVDRAAPEATGHGGDVDPGQIQARGSI